MTLKVDDVIQILGLTRARIFQLDDVLKPITHGRGHPREYDPEIVERVRVERAANTGSRKVGRPRKVKPENTADVISVPEGADDPCTLCGGEGRNVGQGMYCTRCSALLTATPACDVQTLVLQVCKIMRHQIETGTGEKVEAIVHEVNTLLLFLEGVEDGSPASAMKQLFLRMNMMLPPLTWSPD